MKILKFFKARSSTVEHNFDMSQIMSPKPKPSDYIYFVAEEPEEVRGKRVLIFHSTEDGILPQASKEALAKYTSRVDMIYCCYPLQTKNRTGERRIQSHSECKIYFVPKYLDEMFSIILFEKEEVKR